MNKIADAGIFCIKANFLKEGNKMFTQDEKTNCIMTKPIRKTDVKEISAEYTLPDYLPDITRLLRTGARIENPEKYCSGDTVEYEGRVCFDVLYATSDGKIKNASFDTDYSGNVTGLQISDLSSVNAHTYSESVNCRLAGPRKLTVKTKLVTDISICSIEFTEPAIGGKSTQDSAKTLQYRKSKTEFLKEIKAAEKNTPVSEDIEIEPGMPQIGDIVYAELLPSPVEVRCAGGKVHYDGALLANIMYEAAGENGGEYVFFSREVPISGSVEADGVSEGDMALCDVIASNISYRPQADELGETKTAELDFDYSVFFRIFSRSVCEVTTDMYSLDYENTVEREALRYRTAETAKTFNFSFNESASYDDADFGTVLGASCRAAVTSVEKLGTKASVSGNAVFSLIMCGENGTYAGKSFTLPFHADTDMGKFSHLFSFESCACVGNVNARVSDGKIFFDAEITVDLLIFGEKDIEVLKSCTVFTDRPVTAYDKSNIVLYYPSRGDDLWTVAKKYNTTVEKLAILNGITKDDVSGGVLVIPAR